MDERDLKPWERCSPCPFCGNGKIITGMMESEDGGAWVDRIGAGCSSCDIFAIRPTIDEAITAWNTRPAPAQPDPGAPRLTPQGQRTTR